MAFSDEYIKPHTAGQKAAYRRESLGPNNRNGSDMGLMQQGANLMNDEAVRAAKMLREAGYAMDNTGAGTD